MSGESWSFTVGMWKDPGAGTTHIQVTRVADEEAVHLSDGSYIVRVTIDTEQAITRCLVRHVASGREVHVQGGLGLQAFVEDCLIHTPLAQLVAGREDEG